MFFVGIFPFGFSLDDGFDLGAFNLGSRHEHSFFDGAASAELTFSFELDAFVELIKKEDIEPKTADEIIDDEEGEELVVLHLLILFGLPGADLTKGKVSRFVLSCLKIIVLQLLHIVYR